MATMTQLLLTAAGFAVAYCAAPGAVNTEALRRGLARGFHPMLRVELGSLIGDLFWAALALSGVALVVQHRPVRITLGIVGACFLLRLAWNALHEAWRQRTADNALTAREGRGDFTTGIVFSLANPVGIAFWSGVGSLTPTLDGHSTPASLALFFAGFVCGAVIWCLGISVVVGYGRRFVRPDFFRAINALCGLALGYFGLRLLWTTAHDAVAYVADRLAPLQTDPRS